MPGVQLGFHDDLDYVLMPGVVGNYPLFVTEKTEKEDPRRLPE